MATDTERALSIIQEKVELLTGERANGEKRAVRISELDNYLNVINHRANALSKAITNATEATTSEYWETLKKEHDLISSEIDAAVLESSKELNLAITEAKKAIEEIKISIQTARNEAGLALSDAKSALAIAHIEVQNARSEANDAVTEARGEISQARTEAQNAANELNSAIVDAQADANQALAELQSIAQTILLIQSNVANNSSAITQEAGARATADSAIAGQITTIQANVASNSAQITQEAVARANADTALSSRIDNITATAGGATAAIDQEATARANADSALSALISSLTSTVNGNKASADQSLSTLATADSALSGQITNLTSIVSSNKSQFDNEVITRTTATNALAAQLTSLSSSVSTNRADFDSEIITRTNADSALSARIDNITAAAGGATAAVDQEAIARANADNALSALITSLTTTVNNNKSSFDQEVIARTNGDSSLSSLITTLTSTVNNNKATLDQEIITRTNSDSALSSRIDNITAAAGGATAAVDQEAVARAAADDAISALVTNLTTTVNTNKALFDSEVVTRTNADSSLSAQITSISAIASKQRVFRQATAPTSSGRIVGDIWINSNDNNKQNYWDGTGWIDGADSRITTLQSSINTETIARSNADSALSSQITTVSAAASKQRVFMQASPPSTSGLIIGDLWYKSNEGNKPYYWNGTDWADNSDGRFTAIASSVTSETYARTTADEALSAQITSLSSTVNANKATLDQEITTRANADSAISATVSSLTSTVNTNKATLDQEAVTRANADSALSGQITSLTSTVNTNKATLDQEAVTRANADTALSGQITTLSSTVTNNKATLDQEIVTRASADSAISSSLSTLSSTVDGQSASISTLSASYNGVAIKYGVTGTINSQTGGFVLTGIGKNDGSASYLLEITSDVIINGNLLVIGSVKNQGLEDFAASNSALGTGIKSSGNVSIRVRKNSRVACFASYSSNTNDTSGGFLKITANGNSISNVPLVISGKNLPLTTLTVYPGSAGARVQGNGSGDASTSYSYDEQYVAYYYYIGSVGPFPAYATRTYTFPASSAFDNSNSSLWLGAKSGNPWIRYTYTTGVLSGVYKVMGYSSAASGSTQGRAPKAWSLQGSNDGTNWTTLDTRSNQTGWGDQEDRQFTIASPTTFAQYRMVITESVDAAETLVGVVQLSFYLPGTATNAEDIVFNAYVDTAASIAGYVSLYVVELSK